MKQAVLILIAAMCFNGCTASRRYRLPQGQTPETVMMEITGYCKCGKCCGWELNWKLQPVVAYGPQKGRPKAVGITASGTRASPGTIAADTSLHPFGTIMHIPGYGWGRVEDVGGAIQGNHIDLYFTSHKKALVWGRQWKEIRIWRP
jgi:3D (Asp-Asp-Asp) domain-containing protein